MATTNSDQNSERQSDGVDDGIGRQSRYDRAVSYMILDVVSKGIGVINLSAQASRRSKRKKIDDIVWCMTR